MKSSQWKFSDKKGPMKTARLKGEIKSAQLKVLNKNHPMKSAQWQESKKVPNEK